MPGGFGSVASRRSTDRDGAGGGAIDAGGAWVSLGRGGTLRRGGAACLRWRAGARPTVARCSWRRRTRGQLTKVFASFFKKKCFFLLLFAPVLRRLPGLDRGRANCHVAVTKECCHEPGRTRYHWPLYCARRRGAGAERFCQQRAGDAVGAAGVAAGRPGGRPLYRGAVRGASGGALPRDADGVRAGGGAGGGAEPHSAARLPAWAGDAGVAAGATGVAVGAGPRVFLGAVRGAGSRGRRATARRSMRRRHRRATRRATSRGCSGAAARGFWARR